MTELDTDGPRATILGRIDATNAALWVLAVDASAARAWAGADGDGTDFECALDNDEAEIAVGEATGVVCPVGDCGWSYLWAVAGGVALICHYPSDPAIGMAPDACAHALAVRVAQFPVPDDAHLVGQLEIASGLLALLLPYTSGDFTDAELAEAARHPTSLGDRALVPLANGRYDVLCHRFAPERGYADALGTYGDCVRIVRRA